MFKQSAEHLSHVTERERLAQEAVRESQDRGQDTDHVIGEPELPQQPSQSSVHEPNVHAPVLSMPDPDFFGTPWRPC